MSARPRRDDPQMRLIEGEMWLARRLSRFGVLCGTFEGITDSNMRKARLRSEISTRGIADIICEIAGDRPPGTPRSKLTYRAAFERLYGEPL